MISSNVRTAFAAVAGMGALLGGVGAAQAALVQTFSVDEHSGPISQALFFDPATPNVGGNGALTQVTIALSTQTVGGGVTATVLTGGEGATSTRGGLTADLSIGDVSGALFSGSTSVAASTCTINGSAGCTGTTMTPSQPSFTPGSPLILTDGGSLADFVGAPVQISALISNYNLTAAVCDTTLHPSGPSRCGGSDTIGWAPTVTVSYTYDVLAAPEPASLSVLGFAVTTLALARRRRKPDTRASG